MPTFTIGLRPSYRKTGLAMGSVAERHTRECTVDELDAVIGELAARFKGERYSKLVRADPANDCIAVVVDFVGQRPPKGFARWQSRIHHQCKTWPFPKETNPT